MKIPESEMQFKSYFIDHMYKWGEFDRIECPDSCIGFPDVAYSVGPLPVVEGQIEFKWVNTKGFVKIRPAQIKWFRNRAAIDALPFLIWGYENGFGVIECVAIAPLQRNIIELEDLMIMTRCDNLHNWGDENWDDIHKRLRHE